jgi:hypothetical protein
MCSHCQWTRSIGDGDLDSETPQHCLICDCHDLWRQKDFSQTLGVTVVAVGVVLSTIAMAYYWVMWSLGILMAFALADMILYAVMPDCLVCYRCHAKYRQIANLQQTATFDLEVNERYRQEAIRLKQANQSTSST